MSTSICANIFNVFLADNGLWPTILMWLDQVRFDLDWLESYVRESPTLAISLAATVLFPLLAATGSLMRLALPARAAHPPANHSHPSRTPATEHLTPRAILEFQRHDVAPFEIGHAFVRIGRETDNDIKLDDPTVHRYHAVIERTFDGEFHIAYVAAADGNGLRVNGRKVTRHHLTGGEILDIGAIKLRFTTVDA